MKTLGNTWSKEHRKTRATLFRKAQKRTAETEETLGTLIRGHSKTLKNKVVWKSCENKDNWQTKIKLKIESGEKIQTLWMLGQKSAECEETKRRENLQRKKIN